MCRILWIRLKPIVAILVNLMNWVILAKMVHKMNLPNLVNLVDLVNLVSL